MAALITHIYSPWEHLSVASFVAGYFRNESHLSPTCHPGISPSFRVDAQANPLLAGSKAGSKAGKSLLKRRWSTTLLVMVADQQLDLNAFLSDYFCFNDPSAIEK